MYWIKHGKKWTLDVFLLLQSSLEITRKNWKIGQTLKKIKIKGLKAETERAIKP